MELVPDIDNNGSIQVVKDIGMYPKIAKFHCNGDFDEGMSSSFADFYYECKKNDVTHAVIDITSYGGYVHVLSGMCSFIEQRDMFWFGVARGACMSCALSLLAACDYRFASRRAELMFHDMACGTYGKVDEMLEAARRFKVDSKKEIKKFAKRTKHDAKWWLEKANSYASKDYYFSATTAKKLGLVEEIGTPVFTILRQHQLNMEVAKGV